MTTAPTNPYPGLRPFREDEEALFFGREAQVDTMVDKLAATHFLAVVGTSGSGKSSLVNCGLIPALQRGLMAARGSGWRVAVMRPGNQPLRALARALAQPGVLPPLADEDSGFAPAELTEATLRISKLGLVDAYREAQLALAARRNLLVVVDQFEELFRFQALAAAAVSPQALARAADDATAFVHLLLEAAAHPDLPLYIVLTMRSDFLGDCAQFFGLPEAINRGQYLVPRMTRDERRAAIDGPARVSGARIDPVLLTRLVNDVGDNPDQLSILQHALNRTWACWQAEGSVQEPITLAHYERIGTMAGALNQHADEAYLALPEGRPRQLAEQLFKAITDRGTDARGVRRPTRVDTLCAISGAGVDELTAVVDVFRDPSRSFLMPPAGTVLGADSVIDISHESLMRVWDRLRRWGEEEARAAQVYRRLAESAQLHAEHQASLLPGRELALALAWREQQQPNAAWAERYRAGFEQAMAYLAQSEHQQQAEAERLAAELEAEQRAEHKQREDAARIAAERKYSRRVIAGLSVLVVGTIAATSYMVYLTGQERQARRAEELAKNQATAALAQEKQAREQEKLAREKAEQALSAFRRSEDVQRIQQQAIAQVAPAVQARIEQATQATSLVYLQYAEPSQQAVAEQLRRLLGRGGYQAPGIERVGAAPSRTEVRYFRKEDEAAAESLAQRLEAWNLGDVTSRYVQGYAQRAQVRQLEIWLPRADPDEVPVLLLRVGGPEKGDRLAALATLRQRYAASPAAISATLNVLSPEHLERHTNEGRFNLLYFLARTAPIAWTAEQERTARQTLAWIDSRQASGKRVGDDTLAEMRKLAGVLDAVRAGEAAPRTPAAR